MPLPKGVCPACGRTVAILADATVARQHKENPKAAQLCRGYGQKALNRFGMPYVFVAPIQVSKNPLTNVWRVFANGRRDSGWPTFEDAWRRVDELLQEARNEHPQTSKK